MVKGEVLKKIMFNFRDTDYIHTEQHMEMEEDHEEHGDEDDHDEHGGHGGCLLYTSPSPRDAESSRMPSSA